MLPCLKLAAVPHPHIEMARAGTVRFLRLAKEAARSAVLGPFALVMHFTSPIFGAASRRPVIFGEESFLPVMVRPLRSLIAIAVRELST